MPGAERAHDHYELVERESYFGLACGDRIGVRCALRTGFQELWGGLRVAVSSAHEAVRVSKREQCPGSRLVPREY